MTPSTLPRLAQPAPDEPAPEHGLYDLEVILQLRSLEEARVFVWLVEKEVDLPANRVERVGRVGLALDLVHRLERRAVDLDPRRRRRKVQIRHAPRPRGARCAERRLPELGEMRGAAAVGEIEVELDAAGGQRSSPPLVRCAIGVHAVEAPAFLEVLGVSAESCGRGSHEIAASGMAADDEVSNLIVGRPPALFDLAGDEMLDEPVGQGGEDGVEGTAGGSSLPRDCAARACPRRDRSAYRATER